MNKFQMRPESIIPIEYMEDIVDLQNYIWSNMRIDISKLNTYLFWSCVSESYGAGWLGIDYHPEDVSRETFLEDMMDKYGIIIYD